MGSMAFMEGKQWIGQDQETGLRQKSSVHST
jgi:hypothetical protein